MSMTGNDNQNAPLPEDDEKRESSRQPAPDFEAPPPPLQPNTIPRIKNT